MQTNIIPAVVRSVTGFLALLLAFSVTSARAGTDDAKKEVVQPQQEAVTLDDLELETNYTFSSSFDDRHLGRQDSLFNSVEFTRRIPLCGKWYLALGADYSRFDFSTSTPEIPNRLQEAEGIVSLQYVVEDRAAVDIEVRPGLYFAGHATGHAFDAPLLAYVPFKLSSTVFAEIGVRASLMQDPPAVPIGGIIWLINDKWMLNAIFPKPQLIYTINKDFDVWIGGELGGNDYKTDVQGNIPNPTLRNAVVQYTEPRAGVGIDFSSLKPFVFTLTGGYSLYRDFDYYRANTDIRTNGVPYLQFAISAKF